MQIFQRQIGVWMMLSLLLVGSGVAEEQANKSAALVDSVILAYGGAAAVAKMRAFRVEGDVQAHIRGGTGTVRRDVLAPDRLRVTIVYPDRTEVRILAGERGWRGTDRQQQRVHGLPHLAMVYQLIRSTAPWSLLHYRSRLTDGGVRTEGGIRYLVLHLDRGQGLEMDFWIEDASRRVTRIEGTLSAGAMTLPFATRYSDFRSVDGVLFPHAEENFASGRHAGSTTIRSVRFSEEHLGPFVASSPIALH